MLLLRRRYLRALAELICRRAGLFVSLGLVLAVAAAWYAFQELDFKTSRGDLIGRDSEYWKLFQEYADEFGAEEDYVIVVQSDQPAANRQAVDELVKWLLAPENNPHPDDAKAVQQFVPADLFYHVNLDALKPWFLYYLTTDELQQIRGALKDFKQLLAILQHDPKLSTFLETMNRMLMQLGLAGAAEREQMESFLPTITKIIQQLGTGVDTNLGSQALSPWASAFFSEDMVAGAEAEMKFQGYQTFRDGQMFLVLVHPQPPPDANAVHHDATIPKLRRIIHEVRAEHPDLLIRLTGEPVLDYDEMNISQRDAIKSTLLTFVLIALLFAVSFREFLRPLMAVLGMVMVLAMCIGYATFFVGHLNLITVTFAVMILGLGIDLGIQLIARYEEELSGGAHRAEAVIRAIEHTGTSIITAGVTNAAAFFAMGLSGFRGVTELGIIAGGGMLIATAVTVLILPGLLLVVKRKRESTRIPARGIATRIEEIILRNPQRTLLVCGVVTLAALLVGWRVRFDYNVLKLQSHGVESVQTEMALLKADAESTIFAAIVTDTLDETRRVHHSLTGLPSVASVHSIAEILPEDAEKKRKPIAAIREEIGEVKFVLPTFDPADADLALRTLGSLRLRASKLAAEQAAAGNTNSARIVESLAQAARATRQTLSALPRPELEQRVAQYTVKFHRDLQEQLNLMAQQSDRPMIIADVPPELQRMFMGDTGKFLIRVFPKENIWEREPLVRFVHDVQSVAPKVTGTPLGLYEFIDVLLRGYRNAALWAFLVIVILIFIDLRGFYATFLTVLPLMVGMSWMLGAMVLFGLEFNPANIIVLPLLVGIGVAYGIYVVQRYREDKSAEFYGKSTGRAVVLSALVAIVAFASMLIGAHRGIRSLGLIMSIGVFACLIAALLLLPALLEIARRNGWKV